jgi:hypothetical protein
LEDRAVQSALQIALALLIIIVSVAVSLTGLYLVRARFGVTALQSNHEVGGSYFAVLGTAYRVLISFLVAAAWNRYQAAGTTGTQESADLGSMYWLATELPAPARGTVQAELRNYTNAVLNDEWAKMADNQESTQAWTVSDRLWRTVLAIQPSNQHEQTIYENLLTQRQQLDHDRRLRLLSSKDQIPDSLWLVLDVGAILTIFFTFFFGMRRFFPQALMTGTLTALIVLVLLLVYQLDNPYQGYAKIQPTGFYSVANLLNHSTSA